MQYVKPYVRGVAITPHASNNLAAVTHAISVGAAGTMTVVFTDDSTVQLTVTAGQLLPIRAKRVNATGTTATGLVALYYQ